MAARSGRNVEQSAWQNALWTWLKNNRSPCPSRIGLSCRAVIGGTNVPPIDSLRTGRARPCAEPCCTSIQVKSGAGLGLVAAADVAEHHLDQLGALLLVEAVLPRAGKVVQGLVMRPEGYLEPAPAA
jgi:hypothetical protein